MKISTAFTLAVLTAMTLGVSAPATGSAQTENRTNPPAASAKDLSDPAQHPAGARVYAEQCAICHGEKMEGILPAFPPLAGVGRHLSSQQITSLVRHGKGRMPAFDKLPESDLTALLHYLEMSQAPPVAAPASGKPGDAEASLSPQAEAGAALFQQNCAFCHGRDAAGGETGPDLTRSKLVNRDVEGDKIGEVVRNGRPEKNMPHFNFSRPEMLSLVSFIHVQASNAQANKGSRRGVDVADLQTGNVTAGKQYFNGPGECASCHSPSGDLSGLASRLEGLELEERMLYPKNPKSKVTVTLPSGKSVMGTVAYLDEFTVALRDADGTYHSWSRAKVKSVVESPVNAHVELFGKYTDADIHNLMAYLQTLR